MKTNLNRLFWILALLVSGGGRLSADGMSQAEMQEIYEEAKTPFKYGVVLRPPPGGKIDCPNVFHHGGHWFMVYVQLENQSDGRPLGYITRLASSDNLLDWRPLGTILPQGPPGSWDAANAGGGIVLADTAWGGAATLETYDGRYWMAYIGGNVPGYEQAPVHTGIAFTADPTKPAAWQKLPEPVQRTTDPDARDFEMYRLFKPCIIRDPSKSLGASFVMFRNSQGARNGRIGDEKIGISVSDDMKKWRRYSSGPVLENAAGDGHSCISGDPQLVRMKDLWVMFYFGAFWKPGAFDTFAASRDLLHWTKWTGPDLISPSEPWDREFAHKPYLIKHDGVVYHFYCAVGNEGRVIALATSRKLR